MTDQEEIENKVKEPDKNVLQRQSSDFWLKWPKPGKGSSPKMKRSRKLFTKSVFLSDSDKIAVTVDQMSKSIDGSLNDTLKPYNVPKIVITPATTDGKLRSSKCHKEEILKVSERKFNANSPKSAPAKLLQCLSAPSSPSSDNIYMLADRKGKTSKIVWQYLNI